MSKLNRDVLYLVFEELQDSLRFLFSCLMVNKLWCETVIPILWRKPWYHTIYYNYSKRNSIYSVITSYLSNDVKEFLSEKGIKISDKSLAFDYLSFCRSIDIRIIDHIISIGSPSKYNRFLLQEEIYSFLIRKCPEIKYLNIRGTYDLVYQSEAKVRLESLCELTCDTSIDPKYFYRLAHICQRIQRIAIINNNLEVNHGATVLIEFQKNLKYFKLEDDFGDENFYIDLLKDPYTEIFRIITKHANTLNCFEISLQFDYGYHIDYYDIYDDYDYTFLQYSILKLHNLKILELDSPIFLNNNDFNKKLEMVSYNNLEIFDIKKIDIYQATCIIKKSSSLRELWILDYCWGYNRFNDDTLNFICTICENCSLIEYLTFPVFPLLESHFVEFGKLLKNCQKLRSLHFRETYYEEGNEFDFGKRLLNVLIKEASVNLREIKVPYDIRFSLKTLESFFEKWKGRPAISILIDEPYFYQRDDSYKKLISKYKAEGVISYINI
ncbi:hypothetical protein RclHR1_01700004 [Rhizophagus clarus]|uniref:F-box domain-containing protein n=1 Tax=Rhizophagus clarus TaxID=94130 RepID=A0A2Z6QZL0_9GLOM|nr:hypothetical protein RclHR1_01700004 [Rhizophagus clarus]GES86377.1 hypothetical protein GLOIN_2v1791318 [Rhizophagus clarus]